MLVTTLIFLEHISHPKERNKIFQGQINNKSNLVQTTKIKGWMICVDSRVCFFNTLLIVGGSLTIQINVV